MFGQPSSNPRGFNQGSTRFDDNKNQGSTGFFGTQKQNPRSGNFGQFHQNNSESTMDTDG